jgi:hypothetical protein
MTGSIQGLAVDANNLYFSTLLGDPNAACSSDSSSGLPMSTCASGRVESVALSGGAGSVFFTGASQSVPSSGLAVNATSLFWADYADHMNKTALSGGTSQPIVSGLLGSNDIAVDATSVYWTDDTSVSKAPLGGGKITVLASGQNHPAGIAVDETSVYWVNDGTPASMACGASCNDGSVVRTPLAGGAITTLASGQAHPERIAVDATSVYWTNWGSYTQNDGSVMKLAVK